LATGGTSDSTAEGVAVETAGLVEVVCAGSSFDSSSARGKREHSRHEALIVSAHQPPRIAGDNAGQ
jgi:hypothetical protein